MSDKAHNFEHEKKICDYFFLHEFKQGKNAAQTIANINKHGEKAQRVKVRYKTVFRNFVVEMRATKVKTLGRPPIFQNGDLRAIVEQNPVQSIRKISQQLGVSISTVSNHLKQTGKLKA